jgi:8-amino-7-oxononanoate synthase
MSSLHAFLEEKIALRKQEGLFRKLTTKDLRTDFTSNDYLGLARSRELADKIEARIRSLTAYSNGATGSRLLSGNSAYAEVLEKKLAGIFQAESALLFNSGYAANQAVLSSLPQKNDLILYDELAHACIKDGARLSLATRYSFRHNDLNDLESKIKRLKGGRIFIAVESVYSMDGDECPLEELTRVAERYDASLIVDEAHSTGVVGPNGSGLTVEKKLQDKIDIRIHTFGKAMGTHGACVVGSQRLTEYLVNFARPFIYTTALPLHSLVSIDCAFDYLQDHLDLQRDLKKNIQTYLEKIEFTNRTPSTSAIQTAVVPGNDVARQVAEKLQQSGLDVRPILSPTVPKSSERIRICLHTYNTPGEITQLVSLLHDQFRKKA